MSDISSLCFADTEALCMILFTKYCIFRKAYLQDKYESFGKFSFWLSTKIFKWPQTWCSCVVLFDLQAFHLKLKPVKGWDRSSVVDCLLSMHRALGWISSTRNEVRLEEAIIEKYYTHTHCKNLPLLGHFSFCPSLTSTRPPHLPSLLS